MGALMCATHSGRIAWVMSPEIITSNMTFIMLWIFLIPALQRCNKVRPTQHDLWWMRYQMQQRNSLANAHNNTTWGKWRYINCNSVPFWNKLAFLKVARLLKIFEVFSKIFFSFFVFDNNRTKQSFRFTANKSKRSLYRSSPKTGHRFVSATN